MNPLHSFGCDLRTHEMNGIRVSETLMPAGLQLASDRFRGTSVGEYIRETRLRHAMHYVRYTNVPLDEIAVTHGFFDQAISAGFQEDERRVAG